ncbi:MAG: TAXI family TRAP transporter solute-binding subunit [Alphaproteobacteria bacterium]
MMRNALLLGMLAMMGFAGSAMAQSDLVQTNRDKVNKHVLGIMAGRPGSTDLDQGYDLDIAFSDGYDLRILPMVSHGSATEFEDLLYLRGVDMAIIQHDVVEFMDKYQIFPGIKNSVRMIAPLGIEPYHILASKDIQSIYDLAGKKVNFGRTESGTSMTSSVVFDALGIPVDVTNFDHKIALEKMRKGEIAAIARTTGAPSSLFEGVSPDENFHFLPVPASGAVDENYRVVSLTSEQYPNLIAPGRVIETIGVSTVLITYNWPKGHSRGETVDLFTKRFFAGYDKLLEDGFHESWKTIDISEDVPGLTRHWSAEEALRQIKVGSSS